MRALIILLAAGCAAGKPAQTAAPSAGEDRRLDEYASAMLDELWKLNPEEAFNVGYYKYADSLVPPDAAARDAQRAFDERNLAALEAFDEKKLDASHRVDLFLMRDRFQADRWFLDTFRDWQWQPSQYNVADTFERQLSTEYAPLETRLRHMLRRLEKVPAYYAAARANITKPTLEHTELAFDQNKAALAVFGDALLQKVDASHLDAGEKAEFRTRAAAARAAIEGYLAFLGGLERTLADGGARSFRIGKELYAQKFAHQIQSGFTAEELYAKARSEKDSLHDRMATLARELWPRYLGAEQVPADRLELFGRVIGELGKHHVKPDEFVSAVRKQIPALQAFVREKDLLDQDPTRPLVVREKPEYKRGIAGASVEAPGPYDATANTYYEVTPLDGFSPERAESFLREYNDWMLQLLNIHEAIPGHYTQLMHANKSKSLVKTLFGNGAMIEGWAVYGERMILEAGYGGGTPEIWLIWMKWNLRAVCNTILDYESQTGSMTKEQLVAFLTREAFQSQAEAEQKWKRATLSQVQLVSYFDGYAEIVALREEMKSRLGDKFSLKEFHNQFLSYGNAPVRYIRRLMLEGASGTSVGTRAPGQPSR